MRKALTRLAKGIGWLTLAASVGFCALAGLGNAPYKAERDRARRAAASQMIVALEEYHSQVGHYPESLEGLVPRFVSALPEHPGDGKIAYSPGSGLNAFQLEYEEAPWGTLPTDGYHVYNSGSGEWAFEVR